MTQRLPLVAAQPGIWMAEKLSTLPSAWSVAHYVELTGELDASLLAKAVVAGWSRPILCGCGLAKITVRSGNGWILRSPLRNLKLSTCAKKPIHMRRRVR